MYSDPMYAHIRVSDSQPGDSEDIAATLLTPTHTTDRSRFVESLHPALHQIKAERLCCCEMKNCLGRQMDLASDTVP